MTNRRVTNTRVKTSSIVVVPCGGRLLFVACGQHEAVHLLVPLPCTCMVLFHLVMVGSAPVHMQLGVLLLRRYCRCRIREVRVRRQQRARAGVLQ